TSGIPYWLRTILNNLTTEYTFYNYFFFFSSRRRHTRSKRDWSSDVCSSDLFFYWFDGCPHASCGGGCFARVFFVWVFDAARAMRSEERRVGKEWRYGLWSIH